MRKMDLTLPECEKEYLKSFIGKKLKYISVDDSVNFFSLNHSSNFPLYNNPIFYLENNENFQISIWEHTIPFFSAEDKNHYDWNEEFVTFSADTPDDEEDDSQNLEINETISDIMIVQDSYHVWDEKEDKTLVTEAAIIIEFESKRIIFQKGDLWSDYYDVTLQNIDNNYKITLNPYIIQDRNKKYDCGREVISLSNPSNSKTIILEKAIFNLYILRWNPNISSYTMKRHNKVLNDKRSGHYFQNTNWSVYEWKKVKPGDMYILLQVGTENDGIAKIGKFISMPYSGRSWRRDGTKVYYADMNIFDVFETEHNAQLPAELFESEFSQINWHGGHSGELVDSATAEKLLSKMESILVEKKLWDNTKLEEFKYDDSFWIDKDDEEEDEPAGTQAHGDRWAVILNKYKEYSNILVHLDQGKMISEKKLKTSLDDLGEATFIQRQQVQPFDKDSENPIIAVRGIYVKSPADKRFYKIDMFPVIQNGVEVSLTITHIEEWKNNVEAILTGVTACGFEIRFFDSNYAKFKDSYKIGENYTFKLSALAYSAKIIQNEIQYAYSLMQQDPVYIEDAEYADTVRNVKEYRWNNKDFHSFEINIPGGEREEKIYLPVIAPKNEKNAELKDGDFVNGYCWVMGERK